MEGETIGRVHIDAILNRRSKLETSLPGPIMDQRDKLIRDSEGNVIEIRDYRGRTLWKSGR